MKKMLCFGMIIGCLALLLPVPVVFAAGEDAVVVQKLVNINTATAEELETLPGIGPVCAQRIVDYRQEQGRFSSIEQLLEVKGIGSKSLEKISPLVSVE
jgi:competence protein ComEA